MNINSINSFNYNQNFQAKVRLNKAKLENLGTRTIMMSGAAASAYGASIIGEDGGWKQEESGISAMTGFPVSAACLGISAVKPDTMDKIFDKLNNDRKIPS